MIRIHTPDYFQDWLKAGKPVFLQYRIPPSFGFCSLRSDEPVRNLEIKTETVHFNSDGSIARVDV